MPAATGRTLRRRYATAGMLLAVLLLACSSGQSALPARTPSEATAAPFAGTDTDRAFAHIVALAGDIGPRVAGSAEERRAAHYIAAQLEAAGYAVTLEPFPVEGTIDRSQLTAAGGDTVPAIGMSGSAGGEATGPLVAARLGREIDFADVDVRGAVALLARGEITFAAKVANAEQAGAVAVIVVNNVPGPLRGALNTNAGIPVVAVTGDDAELLLDPLTGTGATVRVLVEISEGPHESMNVVGRPSDDPCDAYLGAHYDSVADGPGANDNASGVTTLLEIARTHRSPGLCVVAFGAEEVGLIGSAAFVEQHDVGAASFMLNFDMTAKLTDLMLVVTPDDVRSSALAQRASTLATEAGFRIKPGNFPVFASSDHVSFSRAGVAAITVHSGDDPAIHTARDDLDNVSRESLEFMLGLSAAVLRGLLAGER